MTQTPPQTPPQPPLNAPQGQPSSYPYLNQQQYPQPQSQLQPQQQPWSSPPKKKRSRRRRLLIIGTVVLVLLVVFIIAVANTPLPTPVATHVATPVATVKAAAAAPTNQPTAQPTTKPTNAPTVKPTVKPTTGSGNLVPTYGTPLLGGLITDFIGKYGTPISICPPYSLCWFKDGSTNAVGLIVGKHLDTSGTTTTNGGFTTQVDSVTVQAINGAIWDSSKASDLCTVYIPNDARQLKRIPLVNGLGQASGFDVVYVSASLAKEFTPADFTDSSQNTVQPGTFDIQYLYKGDGTQNIDSCSILIGEQQTQG